MHACISRTHVNMFPHCHFLPNPAHPAPKEGNPPAQLVAIFAEKQFEDGRLLSDYNIQKGFHAAPVLRLSGGMKIIITYNRVRLLMGRLEPTDSVEHVKMRLHTQLAIPPNQQRLIFAEFDELENSGTLSDYGIGEKSTLHLIRRLASPTPKRRRLDTLK